MGQANFQFLGRKMPAHNFQGSECRVHCSLGVQASSTVILDHPPIYDALESVAAGISNGTTTITVQQQLMVMDLDPATAKLAISFLGPFLSAFSFLFILRIVMSWYPKLPVGKFPYVIAYAPTEPLLVATRKLIPPLGGVDVTPVVWFGLLSFLNEILVGPQGLLVLLSQQVS